MTFSIAIERCECDLFLFKRYHERPEIAFWLPTSIFLRSVRRYYEGGVSSVYVWELDTGSAGFAACILFKKTVDAAKKGVNAGFWDAIHVVEVRPAEKATAHYKLTSTILLSLDADRSTKSISGKPSLKLSGSMTRQAEETHSASKDADHLKNVGRMLEEMENRMRDSLQAIAFYMRPHLFKIVHLLFAYRHCLTLTANACHALVSRFCRLMWMHLSAQTVYFGRTKTTVNKMYRIGGASTDKMKAELAQALQRQLGSK